MIGPIEFMMIRLGGGSISGRILPEFRAMRDERIVRLLDAVIVQKDREGHIASTDLSDLSDAEPAGLRREGEAPAWFAQDDIDLVAEQLSENSAAVLLLFEHTWASGISDAVRDANGETGLSGRTSREDLESSASPAPQSGLEEKIALLSRLADLKATGVLTYDEFQEEKQKILAR